MEQKNSIFGPLLLIAAGVVWLLVKSGNVPAENLWALTHIWPYLLIAAGVGLLLRVYWKYATMLLDVLIVAGALLAILYAPQLGWTKPSMLTMIQDGDFYIGSGEPGSGNIVTETRNVDDFSAIEVDYPAEIIVTQGDKASVKVEAEDNVLPGLKTRVRNGALEIYYKAEDGLHVNPSKLVKITIVVTDLNNVHFDSAGELNVNGLETDKLKVSLSGAGNLILTEIAVESLDVNLSGAGSMTSSGTADKLDLDISGFGGFDGGDLHTQSANVSLSGAGSATVWVDDELDAEISGAGSISYYGNADVNKEINGVGSVRSLGDK